MSKVKIQGDAGGTGIFTVAAPATNTDRTIILPDVDATIMTTAGGTFTDKVGIGGTSTAQLTVSGASADRVAKFANLQNSNGSIAYIEVNPSSGGGALFGQTGNSTTTSQYTWIGNSGDDVAGGGGMGIWIYRGTADLKHKALPAYFARAWVNYSSVGGNTIYGSGNVSSVSDVGAGRTQINFATAMPDTNYAAVVGVGDYNIQWNGGASLANAGNGTKSTGSTAIHLSNNTFTDYDYYEVNIVIFR